MDNVSNHTRSVTSSTSIPNSRKDRVAGKRKDEDLKGLLRMLPAQCSPSGKRLEPKIKVGMYNQAEKQP